MLFRLAPTLAKATAVVLAVGAVGCKSPTTMPTFGAFPTATVISITADEYTPTTSIEDLPEFFAHAVAAGNEIASHQERVIIYSQMVDKKNLWLGVSQERDDIRRCWRYQDRKLIECSDSDIKYAFYVQEGIPPIPKMFFAIATVIEGETLVVLDYKHDKSSQDPIDGFRYVLQFDHGSWQVKSWTQVY
ncbi:MAG TPA: hypothetical protein VNK49_07395 [Anaerolineales bacterium]|nr:hypothetical protein [Anaerolineales bacterium]